MPLLREDQDRIVSALFTGEPQMSEELKPCPFCGGKAERHEITEDDGLDNQGGSVISCQKCQASSAVEFEFKETLVERWNRRLLDRPLNCARQALEPFANESSKYEGDNDEDTAWETLPSVGELRRAAAAISLLPKVLEEGENET